MVVAPLDGDRVVAERADLPGRGVVGDLFGLENLVAGHLVNAVGTAAAPPQLGRIDSATTDRQGRLLEQLGLPVAPPAEHDTDEILGRMRLDKKTTGGQLRFVLPSRMGQVELVDDVPEELVRELI